jgi:hypothetical protein
MQQHSSCAMWVSVMLLLCIGLVAAHVSRSHKFKEELFRQQYLNRALEYMDNPSRKVDPCELPSCQDV